MTIEQLKNNKYNIINNNIVGSVDIEPDKTIYTADFLTYNFEKAWDTVPAGGDFILPYHAPEGAYGYIVYNEKADAVAMRNRILAYFANLEIYRAVKITEVQQAQTEEEVNAIDLTPPSF